MIQRELFFNNLIIRLMPKRMNLCEILNILLKAIWAQTITHTGLRPGEVSPQSDSIFVCLLGKQ